MEQKESVIAAGLAIEGKIEGAGHVRIAGNFKGDVHVEGNLTIEPGAKLTGGVRAKTVTVGGELEGNIDAASAVELASTGVMNGDLKAGSGPNRAACAAVCETPRRSLRYRSHHPTVP